MIYSFSCRDYIIIRLKKSLVHISLFGIFSRGLCMVKKCLLTILLVDEANEKTCEEIEEDITRRAESFLRFIPWARELEKVTVLEA